MTTITTQAELDKALQRGDGCILIDSPAGVWIRISASGSATVRAYGSAMVEAYGSATVRAYDSATVEAHGSATVEAYASATVEAYASATVRAHDSATVKAYASATVKAHDSATVKAYASATVKASKYVAVHLHSACATIDGGAVIDATAIDHKNPAEWAEYVGADVIDGRVQLYKNVDDDYLAGHDWNPTAYTVGADVTAHDWRDDNGCGGGLHASPHPHQAFNYGCGSRMLVVSAPLADIRPIPGGIAKCKAETFRVEREVNLDGSEKES